MKKSSKFIISIVFLAATLLVATTAHSLKAQNCNGLRFPIESETTGRHLGTISTDFEMRGATDEYLCLRGTFNDRPYQYRYRCNEDGDWVFVEKLKEKTPHCIWGRIT